MSLPLMMDTVKQPARSLEDTVKCTWGPSESLRIGSLLHMWLNMCSVVAGKLEAVGQQASSWLSWLRVWRQANTERQGEDSPHTVAFSMSSSAFCMLMAVCTLSGVADAAAADEDDEDDGDGGGCGEYAADDNRFGADGDDKGGATDVASAAHGLLELPSLQAPLMEALTGANTALEIICASHEPCHET